MKARTAGRPLRVLILIDSLRPGGAQVFIEELCRCFHPERVVAEVACFSDGAFRERFDRLGTRVHVLASSAHRSALPKGLLKLWRLLRGGDFDLLLTTLEGSFLLGAPLAKLAGLPVVHSMMAVRRQCPRWYFVALRFFQGLVRVFIGCAPEELRQAGIASRKVKAVEIAMDFSSLQSVERDPQRMVKGLELAGAFPVCISLGRLHPDKGHGHAISAWPRVIARYPAARLLIVGYGPDRKRLQELAEQLQVSDSVVFAGFRDDLADLYARADIFLRMSINEGNTYAACQAIATGLPVIGFVSPVPKELILSGESGLLVPAGDDEALAGAIAMLADDPQLRRNLGAAARAFLLDYYDIGEITRLYEQIFSSVVADRPLDELPDMEEKIQRFIARKAGEGDSHPAATTSREH